MSGLRVKFLNAGGKHVAVMVSGHLVGSSAITIFGLDDLNPRPKSLYLTEITFSLQDKLAVELLWGMEGEKEPELLIPLESRGKFDFSTFRGLPSPKEGWDGKVILQASMPPDQGNKAILLVLHLEKA